MQIFIRGGAKLLACTVEQNDTISNIYEYIAEKSGYESHEILLSHHGIPLESEDTVEQHDVVPGAIFDISVKQLGGKTHGQLNKAGRVKAMTPRVPKKEKPKQKTGRARRREQYAQRFSRKPASADGRQHGPNANF